MTGTATKVPEIYKAIGAVRQKMKSLQKNGVGPSTQGGYKFLSIDDILAEVKPLEDEHGIISWMEDSKTEYYYNTGALMTDGRTPRLSIQAHGEYTFTYASTKDGSTLSTKVPGEAVDASDKASRKAVTQAQKIANITLYNIITGEADPDSEDGGSANNAPAKNSPLAKAKASAPARPAATPKNNRDIIVEKFVNSGKMTNDEVKAVVVQVQADAKGAGKPEPKGNDLYAEVLKRLDS